MATNGNHAPLPVLELAKPHPAPCVAQVEVRTETALERRIGEVTADGVIMLTAAMQDFSADGALAARTREQGGELFMRLYQLQQSTMTDDFPGLMHTHGKRVLWERHAKAFRQHLVASAASDEAAFDADLDELIGHLCGVLARVTKTEKIYQAAWPN